MRSQTDDAVATNKADPQALRPPVPAVERCLRILEFLSHQEQPCSLATVSRALGIPKSSARNILATLQARGYVELDHGSFSVGVRTFELGALFLARTQLHRIALPRMESLARQLAETCQLAILDGFEAVFIDKAESPSTLRYASRIGGRAPAYATAVGKALLAALPDETIGALAQQHGFKRFTQHTITTIEALRAELDGVRHTGYAVDDEEESMGFRCVGAPIFDFTNRAIASLSVAGFTTRITQERLPLVAQAVVESCGDISAGLGFTGKPYGVVDCWPEQGGIVRKDTTGKREPKQRTI